MSLIDDLRGIIRNAEKRIESLQNACSHPEEALSLVASSDIVTVYKCGLCEKGDVRVPNPNSDQGTWYD